MSLWVWPGPWGYHRDGSRGSLCCLSLPTGEVQELEVEWWWEQVSPSCCPHLAVPSEPPWDQGERKEEKPWCRWRHSARAPLPQGSNNDPGTSLVVTKMRSSSSPFLQMVLSPAVITKHVLPSLAALPVSHQIYQISVL